MTHTNTTRLCLALSVVVLGACSTGSRSEPSGSSYASGGTISRSGSGGSGTGTAMTSPGISALTPTRGSTVGGTTVRVIGSGFASGSTVEFNGRAANVLAVTPTEITCETPPNAAGVVDVTVSDPLGNQWRLNNGFVYEITSATSATGSLAREADTGNPTGPEQELLELLNRARRDPAAEGRRQGLDFSAYVVQPPLSHNGLLGDAALQHISAMVAQGFVAHLNPASGINANGRILATPYDLHAGFTTATDVNLTENLAAGSQRLLDTPQKMHDGLIRDDGLSIPKHRLVMLGTGQFARNREVGMGYRTNQTSSSGFQQFHVSEYAYTNRNRPFLLGVVYSDDGDGVCRSGEGLPARVVTLSHGSGFTLSIQTRNAGGYAFEILQDGDYTLTIDGVATQVTIVGRNVKVDLRSGQIVR